MECLISRIQHFSTGDGPGIRTTVFFQGCHMRCPWCHNPETQSFDTVRLNYEKLGKTVISGNRMETEDIVKEVLKDLPFYADDNGGCTLSGGEAMLQPDACAAIAESLLSKGVPTLIDTAGSVPWSFFEKVLPFVKQYYYDIKTADADRYRSVCGGDPDLIFGNLSHLLQEKADVHIRIPLIPGFNLSDEDAVAISDLLRPMEAKQIDLLPFHRYGSSKYEAMSLPYAYQETQAPAAKEILLFKRTLEKNGFSVAIEP